MNNQVILQSNFELQNTQQFNMDLLQNYINYVDAKDNTKKDYLKALKPFIIYLYENNINCNTLNRDCIIQYRDMVLQNHKPTTARNYLHAIKLFCQWLHYTGLKNTNPYFDIANVKVSNDFKKLDLTTDQIQMILSQYDADTTNEKMARDYALICLMLCCGLRCIEVVRANINDLQQRGGATYLWVQGKGHQTKDRCVKVPYEVLKAIYRYLQIRGVNIDANGNDALFVSVSNFERGNRMPSESISRIIKTSMRNVGINSTKFTAHSLRHTACTLALKNGATLEQAQQMMRHENIATTMIYNHSIERDANPSENIIANAIFKTK